MKRFVKENWLILLLTTISLLFHLLFPDTYFTFYGAFAYFVMLLSLSFGLIMCIIGIFGGEFTYSSKGLVGWIKEIKNRRGSKSDD